MIFWPSEQSENNVAFVLRKSSPKIKLLLVKLLCSIIMITIIIKGENMKGIYVDFDELAKKDVNDVIKNYTLLTKYKSRLK